MRVMSEMMMKKLTANDRKMPTNIGCLVDWLAAASANTAITLGGCVCVSAAILFSKQEYRRNADNFARYSLLLLPIEWGMTPSLPTTPSCHFKYSAVAKPLSHNHSHTNMDISLFSLRLTFLEISGVRQRFVTFIWRFYWLSITFALSFSDQKSDINVFV